MTLFDYFVLVVFAVCVAIGVWRGLVKELFSLVGWLAAFLLAKWLTGSVAPLFSSLLESPELRYVAAFVSVFMLVLLGSTILSFTLAELIKVAGLGTVDRVLGFVFGSVKGIGLILIVTMLVGLTSIPQKAAWQESIFSPIAEDGVKTFAYLLPIDIQKNLNYEPVVSVPEADTTELAKP